jgi:hypothetical protein
VVPSVAQESLWNADLVAGALEFTWVAAGSFVVAVGTVGGSIAHETLLDALTGVAAAREKQSDNPNENH